MNLAQYAFWYQPFYWTFRKELRLCQEFIADHHSVNLLSEPIVYSELLLRLSKKRRGALPESTWTMFGRSSQLTRRIDDHPANPCSFLRLCRLGMVIPVYLCTGAYGDVKHNSFSWGGQCLASHRNCTPVRSG